MKKTLFGAAPVLAIIALAGARTDSRFSARLPEEKKIVHALNRLTFGPRPGDIERVRSMGLKKWIELQLHPERIREDRALEAKLRPLETLAMSARELIANYPPPQLLRALANGRARLPVDPEKRAMLEQLAERYRRKGAAMSRGNLVQKLKAAKSTEERRKALYSVAPVRVVGHDLVEAKLLRAIYSERQLEEVLTDFWFNHFNVYLNKGADRYLVTGYERDAIRPHVLGKFRDLLAATAESPAMLFYLDNWQSVDPKAAERLRGRRSVPAARLRRGLNENYARELMELHTLGVDGGYTQQDVIEVARCFTGWTIRNPRRGGGFAFDRRLHDAGEKTVLGVRIPVGGGQQDGLKVLDILARHPSTARFISRKLAERFVADNPPESLIEKMAETFTKKDGDIREVLKTMLDSREFWSQGAWRAKVKSPLEMVAGAVRALDAEVESTLALARQLDQLGQPLYRKQEPTGYPNTNDQWVNSAELLARMNFALALAADRVPGVRVDPARYAAEKDPAVIAKTILGVEISPQSLAAVGESSAPVLTAGLVIGSPDFQRR